MSLIVLASGMASVLFTLAIVNTDKASSSLLCHRWPRLISLSTTPPDHNTPACFYKVIVLKGRAVTCNGNLMPRTWES